MNDKDGLQVPKQRNKAGFGSRLSRHISLRGRTTNKVAVEPSSRSASSQGLFIPRNTSDSSPCPRTQIPGLIYPTGVEKHSEDAIPVIPGAKANPQSTKIKVMAGSLEQNVSRTVSNARNKPSASAEVEMRPTLRVVAESLNAPADHKKVMWVAVEIYGGLQDPRQSSYDGDPLDVVIILDNSSSVSDQSIYQACDAIYGVAQLLSTVVGDRLAIICTNVRHPASDFTMACMFHSLKRPDLKALRELPGFALQDRSLRGEQETTVNETLATAFRVLDPGHQAEKCKLAPHELTSRIIVISPSHSIWRAAVGSGEFSVIVHAIDPAIKPQRGLSNAFDIPTIKLKSADRDLPSSQNPQANGWVLAKSRLIESHDCLCSRIGQNDESTNEAAYKLRSMFDDDLQALIKHSRAKSNITELRNLRIKILPMNGCVIKKILGSSSYDQLYPGQRLQTMIQIEVPRHRASFPGQIHSKASSKPSLDTIDSLLYELEHEIGDLHSDLLRVSVTFDDLNPHLKTPRTVTVEETYSIRRSDPSSLWSNVVSCRNRQPDPTKLYNEVYNRLMYEVASCSSPEKALMRLRHLYSITCYNSILVANNAKVEEELRYQRSKNSRAVVCQVSDTAQSQVPSLVADSNLAPASFRVQPLVLGACSSSDSNKTVIHYEANRIDSSVETGTPRSADSTISDSPRDAARRVWRRMRETTHTTDSPNAWSAERSSYEEERADAIRATALRNKRSVGAATLRSLSEGMKENFSPF